MAENPYFFQSPGPILLDLGMIQLRWYGLMYGLAFTVCYFVCKKLLQDREIFQAKEDSLINLLYTILLSGIIGARIWYVILAWDFYSKNLGEILQIWHGGQSIQGGILGAVLGTLVFQRKNFLEKLSLIAVVAPLAQAIGRWGNFFNEEAYGNITNLPWKIYISHTDSFHHPCFLYESIWNLICFFIMLKLFYKPVPKLALIASYLALYSIGRLIIEPFRTDSLMLVGFPAASLIAVFTFVFAIILLAYDYKHRKTNR